MDNKENAFKYFVGGILATLALVAVYFFTSVAYGELTGLADTPAFPKYEQYTFLSATTTSATSTAYTPAYPIAGAKKMNWYFSRAWGAGNAGASKFSVEVSPDGTTWYDWNKLLGSDVSETATSSVHISAGTTTVTVSMNMENRAFQYARCIVEEITDGSHSCSASAQW